jgi:hypothetical protein
MPRNTLFFPLSSLSSRQAPTNLQTFKEALGGFTAPPVTDSGNEKQPFLIDGEAVGDFATAVGKSCDKQKNDCADAANGDQRGVFEVGDCDEQNSKFIPTFPVRPVQNAELVWVTSRLSGVHLYFHCANVLCVSL